MVSARRLGCRAVIVSLVVSSAWLMRIDTTMAVYSGSASGLPHRFAGASFTPTVTPVPSVSTAPAGMILTWTPSSLTSGEPVWYQVTRSGSDNSVMTVCTGTSAPVELAGVVSCTDSAVIADVTYQYRVQPYAQRNGVTTWTAAVSAPSSSTIAPRLVFASIGPVATATSTSPITVLYPSGTAPGDVLMLVERSARVANIVAPTGWTELVSAKVGYTQSTLFLAWRVADAATSVSFQPKANSDGSATWIIRYRRTTGNVSTPVFAAAAVATEAANPSATFGVSTALVTNTNNATIVSLATILATNPLSLAVANSFGFRDATTATSGIGFFALGVADLAGVANGTSTLGPTWAQSGTPGAWHLVTVAFS